MKTVLLTSNKNKIAEFKKYIPELTSEIGEDQREVSGTADEVIIYKALNIPQYRMVEDTILEVNGVEVVDIRYSGNNAIKSGDNLVWITKLGYNSGDEIKVFTGKIEGIAVLDRLNDEAFGFDDVFQPLNSDKTLFELKEDKVNFSARKLAIENYISNNPSLSTLIEEVKEWKGEYQC